MSVTEGGGPRRFRKGGRAANEGLENGGGCQPMKGGGKRWREEGSGGGREDGDGGGGGNYFWCYNLDFFSFFKACYNF